MNYLSTQRAIDRRRDPLKILPECKSILVVAINYVPTENSNKSANSVKIGAYALGEDYHEVIDSRLKHLVRLIELKVGKPFPYRIYTDTGPLLERELAQRAGLGWIGKNTCLINPEIGSFFLLGEILLGISLTSDLPFEADRCGSCTRCIDSCPTQCILPNRTIDAGKCISYLTIEKRGDIPQELRGFMGSWIFGCDICQDVCPWNLRFASPSSEDAFHPRPFLSMPELTDFLPLTEEQYRTNLKNSPLKRAKHVGLKRNSAVAAGNTKTPETIALLTELLLDHPESVIRSHSAWALGQFKASEAMKALEIALEKELDPATRGEISAALSSAKEK
jgi:epoxyqueuosine reductase